MADISQSQATSTRAERQAKLLHAYIVGLRAVQNVRDVYQFIQAICAQADSAGCIEKLGCNSSGLEALRKGLRFDTSVGFINGLLRDFLLYLSVPEVKRLCNGDFLKRVLEVVVSPPSLWEAMSRAQQNDELSEPTKLSYAWLLLELLAWPGVCPVDVDNIAATIVEQGTFTNSQDRNLRALGYRIEHILRTKKGGLTPTIWGPGGRHDNDFSNFRQIAIYPTEDELTSKDPPYYSTAHALIQLPKEDRVAHHLDNQFRLLREDFLVELRDDLATAAGTSARRRQRMKLSGLSFAGVRTGGDRSRVPASIAMKVRAGLSNLTNAPDRRDFLKNNHSFMKHQSFGYFTNQGRVIAFGTVSRDEDLLCEDPPVVAIRTPAVGSLKRLLLELATSTTLDFVLIDTAVFAYEPVLQCLQAKLELPLWQQILCPDGEHNDIGLAQTHQALADIAYQIEKSSGQDLQQILKLPKPAQLDFSQTKSLLAGLRQSLSLIQGPPGTGKSFIGALLAKAFHDNTTENILVVCYTNHALDQFLKDLMDIGIPSASMVRLGSKSSARTQILNVNQQAPPGQRTRENWDSINRLNEETTSHARKVDQSVTAFKAISASEAQMLDYLEFSEDDYEFFEAFVVPESEDGFRMVGEDGREINRFYLLRRWCQGKDPGVFGQSVSPWHLEIWKMSPDSRAAKQQEWRLMMLSEAADDIVARTHVFDASQQTLLEALGRQKTEVIQNKRIVACTTTAASMYSKQLQSSSPGIVLVEEAGEILESHVLTAMTSGTKQLVLIGDHRQLRPKVNNYALTVEKGDGFDLNRSLFERLVLAGVPHTTLTQQHRMCPEISGLIRQLTYPNLLDAPSTCRREPLRGLQSRVVFIKHMKLELHSHVADRRDQGASTSKQNAHEIEMVKKIVRYMAQQGYGTADQVVLTPYLGQLGLLRRELAKDNDPVLNDMDSFDLVRAGLLSPASASQKRRPLHLSTVDNYQGEESDVVIVSLTRSNPNGDIGFMISPERLNVLLSRARKALIIIGNPATFLASKKGSELWSSFFALLAETNSVLEGLPVKCAQHPDREMILTSPDDFDQLCPDGGCSAPCGVTLSCGKHKCPQKCHRSTDHSKMPCTHRVKDKCPQGHKLSWTCSEGHPVSCRTCDAEAAARLVQQQRNAKLDQARQARQSAYACELAKIQAEIDHIRQAAKDQRELEEQDNELAQRRKDLENAKSIAARQKAAAEASKKQEPTQSNNTPASHGPIDGASQTIASEAKLDWDHQKAIEGAKNETLDQLMDMIGLETVKEQFLEIKSKIDLLVRQGLSVSKERFGAALLGNPGTGKTTTARLYAKFLCSVGALPGDNFVESTGAKLASEGVQGCKKLVEDLLNRGGGAFFIDEAYQLASGSSIGGGAVLDYLLPEVENLTGKVVFILAGYNKQMEKFFQHNPGLPSRFPRRMQFDDYSDDELLAIMKYNLSKRYGGRMKLEDGDSGLYARIVARRIGRGRGKEGFGNAREVENMISNIASRQARRVRNERKVRSKQATPDDMLFTKIDLIGPEPKNVLAGNKSWLKLQKLTGLDSVKESVKALLSSIQNNYQRELAEEPLVEYSLNKVFIGNPGTGKTTVAKCYGQILADIGMLSSGEVVIKKPADFVGSVMGASEANTKGILDAAVGKVLVIDEAYGLYGGSQGGTSDPYRTAVIDTIVAEIQGVPGDDRCVLLLGYKEQMEEMFQHVNPGLARRFPITSGFVFEDFNDDDMAAILKMKLEDQGFKVTERAREVALGLLQRARNRPHFGNAGEVDIVLNDAKLRQQKRIRADDTVATGIFEASDFDPDFDRGDRADTNLAALFKDTVGCENIVAQLQGYQTVVANMRQLDMDPREQIPFAFLFRGPPGTGKTTTARKMGKVFYDMGFLSKAEVVACSASDLVGEYVGQTGPKTRNLLESALGKVLFIDEAYRLSGGMFAQEALDELVDCLTNERFFRKLVVILAGYDADINRLMSMNPGLTSRFPETVVFEPLKPEVCLELLSKTLGKKKGLDISAIENMSIGTKNEVLERFSHLASLANFANARDVHTLGKTIFGTLVKRLKPKACGMVLTQEVLLTALDDMIAERAHREADAASAGASGNALPIRPRPPPSQTKEPRPRWKLETTTMAQSTQDVEVELHEQAQDSAKLSPDGTDDHPPQSLPSTAAVQRDAGVSDAVWAQLQLDRLKAEEEEREFHRLQAEERKLREWLKACANAQHQIELKEQERRRKEWEELERKRKEAEEKQRVEALAQTKLQQMGCCPVGFRWIKQQGGWRCAGGSHWIDEGRVDELTR